MGLGLALSVTHRHQQHAGFSRVFERCPVLIGRDDAVANCILPDTRVSRLHASLDIRERWICVRDSGSTNGTFIGTQRVPSDRWVAVIGLTGSCEIRIDEWLMVVSACEVKPTPGTDAADFLTSVPPEIAAQAGNPAATMLSGDVRVGDLPPVRQEQVTEIPDQPAFRIARSWTRVVNARNELVNTLAAVIEAAPPHQRAEIVREVLQTCADIEREPGVRALLERHGGRPVPHTVESASALALRELARWYVSGEPPPANASEVFAFARKLKMGIDEFLLGILPMFSGLDRFEQQMALDSMRHPQVGVDLAPSSRLPRAPRDAARQLFNWRDPSDSAIRAVRTDLVDLTMHQVAVLNGVMRGVKQLLWELAPSTIEKVWRSRLQKRSFFGRVVGAFGAAAERWELYRERHGDLADEENERFRVIFGPEFAAEYKQSGANEQMTIVTRATPQGPAPRGPGPTPPPGPMPPGAPPQGNARPQAWPPTQGSRPPNPQNRT